MSHTTKNPLHQDTRHGRSFMEKENSSNIAIDEHPSSEYLNSPSSSIQDDTHNSQTSNYKNDSAKFVVGGTPSRRRFNLGVASSYYFTDTTKTPTRGRISTTQLLRSEQRNESTHDMRNKSIVDETFQFDYKSFMGEEQHTVDFGETSFISKGSSSSGDDLNRSVLSDTTELTASNYVLTARSRQSLSKRVIASFAAPKEKLRSFEGKANFVTSKQTKHADSLSKYRNPTARGSTHDRNRVESNITNENEEGHLLDVSNRAEDMDEGEYIQLTEQFVRADVLRNAKQTENESNQIDVEQKKSQLSVDHKNYGQSHSEIQQIMDMEQSSTSELSGNADKLDLKSHMTIGTPASIPNTTSEVTAGLTSQLDLFVDMIPLRQGKHRETATGDLKKYIDDLDQKKNEEPAPYSQSNTDQLELADTTNSQQKIASPLSSSLSRDAKRFDKKSPHRELYAVIDSPARNTRSSNREKNKLPVNFLSPDRASTTKQKSSVGRIDATSLSLGDLFENLHDVDVDKEETEIDQGLSKNTSTQTFASIFGSPSKGLLTTRVVQSRLEVLESSKATVAEAKETQILSENGKEVLKYERKSVIDSDDASSLFSVSQTTRNFLLQQSAMQTEGVRHSFSLDDDDKENIERDSYMQSASKLRIHHEKGSGIKEPLSAFEQSDSSLLVSPHLLTNKKGLNQVALKAVNSPLRQLSAEKPAVAVDSPARNTRQSTKKWVTTHTGTHDEYVEQESSSSLSDGYQKSTNNGVSPAISMLASPVVSRKRQRAVASDNGNVLSPPRNKRLLDLTPDRSTLLKRATPSIERDSPTSLNESASNTSSDDSIASVGDLFSDIILPKTLLTATSEKISMQNKEESHSSERRANLFSNLQMGLDDIKTKSRKSMISASKRRADYLTGEIPRNDALSGTFTKSRISSRKSEFDSDSLRNFRSALNNQRPPPRPSSEFVASPVRHKLLDSPARNTRSSQKRNSIGIHQAEQGAMNLNYSLDEVTEVTIGFGREPPKSLLNSALRRPGTSSKVKSGRKVVFGSPEFAEYNKGSPSTSFTPLLSYNKQKKSAKRSSFTSELATDMDAMLQSVENSQLEELVFSQTRDKRSSLNASSLLENKGSDMSLESLTDEMFCDEHTKTLEMSMTDLLKTTHGLDSSTAGDDTTDNPVRQKFRSIDIFDEDETMELENDLETFLVVTDGSGHSTSDDQKISHLTQKRTSLSSIQYLPEGIESDNDQEEDNESPKNDKFEEDETKELENDLETFLFVTDGSGQSSDDQKISHLTQKRTSLSSIEHLPEGIESDMDQKEDIQSPKNDKFHRQVLDLKVVEVLSLVQPFSNLNKIDSSDSLCSIASSSQWLYLSDHITQLFEQVLSMIIHQTEEGISNLSIVEDSEETRDTFLALQDNIRGTDNRIIQDEISLLQSNLFIFEKYNWDQWLVSVIDSVIHQLSQRLESMNAESHEIDDLYTTLENGMNFIEETIAKNSRIEQYIHDKSSIHEMNENIRILESDVGVLQREGEQNHQRLKTIDMISTAYSENKNLFHEIAYEQENAESLCRKVDTLTSFRKLTVLSINTTILKFTFLGPTPVACLELSSFVMNDGTVHFEAQNNHMLFGQRKRGMDRKVRSIDRFLEVRVSAICSNINSQRLSHPNLLGPYIRRLEWEFCRLEDAAWELSIVWKRYDAILRRKVSCDSEFELIVEFGSKMRVTFLLSENDYFSPLKYRIDSFSDRLDVDTLVKLVRKKVKPGFGCLARTCGILSAYIAQVYL